jgi:hypothetical protein
MAWRVLSPYILHSAFSLSKGDCPKKVQPVQVITEKRELISPNDFPSLIALINPLKIGCNCATDPV